MIRVLLFISILSLNLIAQRPPEAQKLADEAIILMGEGNFQKAIEKLEAASEIAVGDDEIAYEIAHAYYQMKSYREAVEILDTLVRRDDSIELYFQLLGNSYDYLGRKQDAITIYEYGLKKFPRSARLYTELGTAYIGHSEEEERCQSYWQLAIELNPTYDEVYYRIAKYFFMKEQHIAGIYFGELFLNTTFNEGKFIEINHKLYEAYNKSLCSTCPENLKMFNNNSLITLNKNMLHFVKIYQYAFKNKFNTSKDSLLIKDIHELRKQFLFEWKITKSKEMFDDPLIDYWYKINDKGLFEEYNYWLLSEGSREQFIEWAKKDNNYQEFTEFVEWKTENRIEINPELTKLKQDQ